MEDPATVISIALKVVLAGFVLFPVVATGAWVFEWIIWVFEWINSGRTGNG